MTKSAVGELIAEARAKKGLSQRKAGKVMDIADQFLWRIEKGESPLPLVHAKKIMKTLGIKKNELLNAYLCDFATKVEKVLNAKTRRH